MPVEFTSVADAIKAYREMRDDLSDRRKEFQSVERELKSSMEEISMWLRDKADEIDVDSFKTTFGTAFRQVKTRYVVGNWEEFTQWVSETDNFQCLEKRAAKLAVKEIHDDTGDIPPGLDYSAEVEMVIRSPSK